MKRPEKDTVPLCSSNVIPAYACAQRGTCFFAFMSSVQKSYKKIQDRRISNSLSVHILYVLYIHWSKAKYGFLSETKRCHQTNTIQNNTLFKKDLKKCQCNIMSHTVSFNLVLPVFPMTSCRGTCFPLRAQSAWSSCLRWPCWRFPQAPGATSLSFWAW